MEAANAEGTTHLIGIIRRGYMLCEKLATNEVSRAICQRNTVRTPSLQKVVQDKITISH